MADEEKVDSSEQTGEIEAEPKKKSLFKKFSDYVEKDNEKWENGGAKKAVQGRELSPEEKGKIEALATDFWNSYGKDHQDDIQSWANHEKGQKLIKHFVSDGKNQELYTNCDAYKSCFDAYQKANGDKNYNYDESSVDFSRLQTPYDVSFYIVLDGFPDWLLSTTNQHTKNFVMARFKEGDSVLSICKAANEKLGKTAAASKDDKDAQKEGNESENEEKQEDKKEEEQKTEEKQEEHKHEKDEFDGFCAVCAKKQLPNLILYGKLSDQFNDYQKSYIKNAIELNGSLSDENIKVVKKMQNKEEALKYFNNYKDQFDMSFLNNLKNEVDSQKFNNKLDKDEFFKDNKNNDIDKIYAEFLAGKNNAESQAEKE